MKELAETPSGNTNIGLHSKINSWIAVVFLLVVCKVLSDLLTTLTAKWLQSNNFEAANIAIVGGSAGAIAAFVVTFIVGRFLAELMPFWPPLSGILMTRGATEITRGARIVATVSLLFLALAILEAGFIAENSRNKETARVAAEKSEGRGAVANSRNEETARVAAEKTESSGAVAKWVSIAIHDEPGSFIVYADPTTIRRSGNMVTIWELTNYTAPQVITTGVSFLSMKVQREYDCIDNRIRSLFQAQFSGGAGAGNVVSSLSVPTAWIPIPPGSIAEITLTFACGKR